MGSLSLAWFSLELGMFLHAHASLLFPVATMRYRRSIFTQIALVQEMLQNKLRQHQPMMWPVPLLH